MRLKAALISLYGFITPMILVRSIEKESEADSDDHEKAGDVSHGYEAAREALKACDYDNIIK